MSYNRISNRRLSELPKEARQAVDSFFEQFAEAEKTLVPTAKISPTELFAIEPAPAARAVLLDAFDDEDEGSISYPVIDDKMRAWKVDDCPAYCESPVGYLRLISLNGLWTAHIQDYNVREASVSDVMNALAHGESMPAA